MAVQEKHMDVIQGPSGSYNLSAYEVVDWPSADVSRPKYSEEYPAGLLGPECLLVSDEVGSSYPYLHTRGPYEQWRADQENKKT